MAIEQLRHEYRTTEQSEAGKLRTWLDVHGVKAVIFDLDDTLIDMFAWEQIHEREFLGYVGQRLPEISPAELKDSFDRANHEAYVTHSVHRDRWYEVLRKLSAQYGEDSGRTFTMALPILMHVYEDVPPMLPGARATIDMFRTAVEKLGLVTHAEEVFTNLKLDTHNIRSYFDVIQIADAHGKKTSNDWQAAVDALGVKPEETLVIGDNVVGDIQAAHKIGVKYTVVLPSPWENYTQGHVPDQTIRAKNISDVIPQIIKH